MIFFNRFLKIFNHFIHFSSKNDKLNVKKNVSRSKAAWLNTFKHRDLCSKSTGSMIFFHEDQEIK